MKSVTDKTHLQFMLLLFFSIWLCVSAKMTNAAELDVAGKWVVPGGDAVIEISHTSAGLELQLVRLLEPGGLDVNNPQQSQRSRAVEGMIIGSGFELEDGVWRGGSLYDPDSGKTYKASLQLMEEDRLSLRGFIGVAIIGRTQTWLRYERFRELMLAMLQRGESAGSSHDH